MAINHNASRWLTIAAFAGPIALVKIIGLGTGGMSPAAVEAAPSVTIEPPAATAPPPKVELPPGSEDAAARADLLASTEYITSPFYHPPQEEPPQIIEVIEGEDPPSPPPVLELQAFVSGIEPIALVDGEYCRVGDTIEETWFVSKINVNDRSIELTDSLTERVVIYKAKRPGEE